MQYYFSIPENKDVLAHWQKYRIDGLERVGQHQSLQLRIFENNLHRVLGLGFMVWDFGFEFEGLGFEVEGS